MLRSRRYAQALMAPLSLSPCAISKIEPSSLTLGRGETIHLTRRSTNALQKRDASLRRASDRQRFIFIETDIETAITFLQMADTEFGMGNMERVTRLIGSARTAHETTGKFLARVTDPEDRRRLCEKLGRLEAAIRDVEHRVQSR